ncbi:MAG: AI-2E family transporter [Actinomycetota bacterium]|nr:AI-2E family transporter [Actinomycetota bacterium]
MARAERQQPLPEWIGRVGQVSWAFLGFVGAIAVLVLVVGALRDLVVPLVLAGFLATVFAPTVDRLERRRVPRAFGALLVIALIFGVLAVTATIVVIGVVGRSDELTLWFDEAQDQLTDVSERWNLEDLVDDLRSGSDDAGPTAAGGIGERVGTVVGSAASVASGIVLGTVLLYYLLKDGARLVRQAAARRTPEASAQNNRIIGQAAGSIRAYVRGRTILALVQGIAVALMLWVMGVPLAGSVGVVNLIGAYIPYLGAFVGGAFAVLMGLAGGGTSAAIAALAVVLFVNLVLENLLEPRLVGSSLALHPMVVLLATVGGGVLVGIVGLVLAAPLVSIGLNLFRELRDSGFFGSAAPGRSGDATTGDATTDDANTDDANTDDTSTGSGTDDETTGSGTTGSDAAER